MGNVLLLSYFLAKVTKFYKRLEEVFMSVIRKDVSKKDQMKFKKLKIQGMLLLESHSYQILITKPGFISVTKLSPSTGAKVLIPIAILIRNNDWSFDFHPEYIELSIKWQPIYTCIELMDYIWFYISTM